MDVFWDAALWVILVDVSEVLTNYIITLLIEAGCISETSVNMYQTTQINFPENNYRHTLRRENLKSRLTPTCVFACVD
jgi:hypothetical protein